MPDEVPTGRRLRRGAAVAFAAAAALAGCGVFGQPQAPRPCEQVYSSARCQAITDLAASRLDVTREEVAAVVIIPEPTPQVVDGKTILQTRSGGAPLDVDVTLADGSTHRLMLGCIGVDMSPVCLDPPRLVISSPTIGGYFDTPEGSTPVPGVEPEALAAARPLRINRLDIPMDHTGPYEVRLGEATLPNGRLSRAEFALVDEWPPDVTIISGGVRLEVRSLETGERLGNVFEHGWLEGTEPVEAILIFDVFRFDPGAALAIRDLVVE